MGLSRWMERRRLGERRDRHGERVERMERTEGLRERATSRMHEESERKSSYRTFSFWGSRSDSRQDR
jgi:hypothetical protein